MNPTHRASVQPVGFAFASHLACTFSAGGSGGAAITALDTPYPSDAMVAGIVDLLQAPALEACDVVGDLFTSLLTSYMQLKTGVVASSSTLSTTAGMEAYAAVVQAQESAPSMLQLLVALTEVVGPAVLRSGASILQCLVTVIDMYTSSTSTHSVYAPPSSDDDDDETAMDVLSVCLGMVTTILEVGARDRAPNEEALLKQLLPSLEALSMHPKIDIAEMASELRLQLLARASNAVPEPKFTALTFANILALSEKDLQSPSVPLRARGLVRLNKLIRSRQAIDVAALMKLFLAHLHDAESYVFLASIQVRVGIFRGRHVSACTLGARESRRHAPNDCDPDAAGRGDRHEGDSLARPAHQAQRSAHVYGAALRRGPARVQPWLCVRILGRDSHDVGHDRLGRRHVPSELPLQLGRGPTWSMGSLYMLTCVATCRSVVFCAGRSIRS